METKEQLALISKAWGRQSGYCFFPTIRGDAEDKKARILSYTEGQAYLWPRDREKIIAHLERNKHNDVYWCPSLFEGPKRRLELAMDEHCLWADLDEVDPREIHDYPPTISWETSPGRFQALWLISGGDMQGASWAGRENQALTYHLGADISGWDTTQLLRIPGWPNHKPDYRRKDGSPARGKIIQTRGRRYLVDEFNELPDVPSVGVVVEILEDEIDRIDRQAVWGRVRLKVSQRVRELVAARSAMGDRSDALWEIERELADAGCTVPEIVSIVRATVWNKFEGRSDEIRRLTTEAAKAVGMRSSADDSPFELADDTPRPKPTNLFELVKDLPPPQWLVRDVLTAGAVGFVAGQPKSFKSWAALDLALSVASGQPFLGHFPIEMPGPVLYVQEEDSGPMVRQRLNKVWPGKLGDKLEVGDDGEVHWIPGKDVKGFPHIAGYIGQGFTISDPGWQVWLDETLTEGYEDTGIPYRLVVFDPLMMMAGEVEENRAQQMTEHVFKPLKQLARKHNIAIQVVHHMKKGDPRAGAQRGGQLLLGSVANHAWAEDSMYFKHGRGGTIVCEQESKSAPVPGFTISHIRNRKWEPLVSVERSENDDEQARNGRLDDTQGPIREAKGDTPPARKRRSNNKLLPAMSGKGPMTAAEIGQAAGITGSGVHRGLQRAITNGLVLKMGHKYTLTDAGLLELTDA